MLVDTLTLVEGAEIRNLTVAHGTSNPSNPTLGELFYRSDSSQLYVYDGSAWGPVSSSGAGTVTSVALSAPSIFSVSGSPVTTSGTLTFTLATQTANKVFAGPTTGSAAQPTFRSLVDADIPTTLSLTTASSLSTVGTITSGTWNATTIAINHGGTGQTTANAAFNALAPSQTSNSGKFLTTDGTNTSWATTTSSPAGSDTLIQFNNSGAFGSDVDFSYTTSTKQITIGNNSIAGVITNGSASSGLTIIAGTSSSGINAGTMTVSGGLSTAGVGSGGTLLVNGGDKSGGSGVAGTATIRGGNGTSSSASGGSLTLNGGDASAGGDAGGATLRGGNASSSNGIGGTLTLNGGASNGAADGGAILMQSGTGGATGAGGSLLIQGGSGGSTSGNGGTITVAGGTKTSGTAGSIIFKTNNTTRFTINDSGTWLLAAAAGTSGQVLTSNGSGAAPTWESTGGVSSITGTTNQVIASASTGAVTLSLPQSIATSSTPTFAQLTISNSPSAGTDTANKNYVDAVAAGLTWKIAVKAATTVNLTGTYVGTPTFTLTNNSTQAAFIADGISFSTGQRVLVKNQSTASQNGLYSVTTVGSGASNWVLTRTTDFDSLTPTDEINGAAVYIEQGSTYASTQWTETAVVTTFDTDAITWTQFAGTGAGVTSIAGTTNRLTTSASTGAVTLDISSSYVGQSSITTLGTVTTGTWSATTVAINKGGTGLSTTPTDGQLLVGSTSGSNYVLASLTAGTGISVTNASGSITVANTGATSIAGTSNQVTASASTGALTLSIPSTFIAPGSLEVTTTSKFDGLTYQSTAAISAAGTTQGAGTVITSEYNIVTIPNSGNRAIVLPTPAFSGVRITIINTSGSQPILLFPASGGAIDSAGTNASLTIPRNGNWTGQASTTTQWYSVSPVTSISGTSNQIASTASAGGVTTLSIPSTFNAPGYIKDTTGLYESTSASVSAAGSTQGGATALTTSYNVVTTVASGQGVALPTPADSGFIVTVVNRGANDLSVYPASGGKIDAATTNTAITVPVNTTATFNAASTTQWYSSVPTLIAGSGISVSYGNGATTITNTGGGTASSVPLSGITSATGANTGVNSGDNDQSWNWALSTAAKSAFKITENTASTNGAGSQFLLDVGTIATSTAAPLRVQALASNVLTVSSSGEMLIGSGSSAGTSGQVLTSNGAGTSPTWQTAGGSGTSVGLVQAVNMGLTAIIF